MGIKANETSLYRAHTEEEWRRAEYDSLAKRAQTPDSHLNLLLFLLHGIPEYRREHWMRVNMPRTLAMLGFSGLFDGASRNSYRATRENGRERVSAGVIHAHGSSLSTMRSNLNP